jgi:hypothetical protein
VEFGVTGERLSVLVIGIDFKRQIWKAIDLAEELDKIVGLFDNISLTDVLGVGGRSYNGRLTSK